MVRGGHHHDHRDSSCTAGFDKDRDLIRGISGFFSDSSRSSPDRIVSTGAASHAISPLECLRSE
jgi:hypothetical protein